MNEKNRQHMVPLKDLNLSNRFLFDEVMEDLQTQQEILSIILGREIPLLKKNETEKEFRLSPLARSIRMDVFSADKDQTVYGTEMQNCPKTDLAKRSRYYQALMDTSLLEPGIPNYNVLNNTYLIMIMTFDLFGYGRYQYTFRPACEEVPGCRLEDGTTRIFLNTRGKNDSEVSEELIEFLHYVENTTDEAARNAHSDRIRRIHKRVCMVRSNERIGVKYMQAWEEEYYAKEEARRTGWAEGLKEGIAEGIAQGIAQGMEQGIAQGMEQGIAQGVEQGIAQGIAQGMEQGIAQGMEQGIAQGVEQGVTSKLKEQIRKKLARKKTVEEIASELEEDEGTIRELIAIIQNTPLPGRKDNKKEA